MSALRHPVRIVGSLVCLLVLSSCGGGGTEVVGPSNPNYIPDFTFDWQNRLDSTHAYNFSVSATQVRTGQFIEGSQENYQGNNNSLTGTFTDRALAFTVVRPSGSVNVKGTFINDDTIELRWPGTTVTIIRIRQ
jgi:hypothetical protein